MIATKGTDLEDLSVTKWIMSAHKKDKIGILNVLGEGKVTRLGGQPKWSMVLV